jgi:hypothetical protein
VKEPLPHRDAPCANCPWRRDSPAGEFPPERYEALSKTAGKPGAEAGLTAPIFACHKSSEDHPRACAGWLARCGRDHLGIRLAVIEGRMLGEVTWDPPPDWPALFDSYGEMAARNGVAK